MESERPKGPQGEGRCRRASRTGQGGNGNKQKAREQGAVKMCRTFITHDIHASSSSCIDTVRVPSAWEQLAWVAKTGARIISVGEHNMMVENILLATLAKSNGLRPIVEHAQRVGAAGETSATSQRRT